VLRSLRARLLLLTLFVAGIAILTVSLLSRQAVRTEFIRFESRSREAGLADAADALGTRLTSDGDVPTPAAMAGADSILRGVERAVGQPLLLLDAEGHVLAASSAALRAARVNREAGDRLAIVEEAREGTTRSLKRTVVVGGPRVVVRTPGGAPLGTLYLLPNAAAERVERPFVATVNRWLLLAVLGAGAVAFLLALALTRRILGPVESLTKAARRMGSGDLSQRVAVRSGDEIGELGRAFNGMADALERNEALRRGLVTDVAHELRTPLTNLRCQIEAIQDGLLPADPAAIRSLHEETLLLSRLVTDLQDLAMAEAGRLPLHRASVDLGSAVEAALASLRPLAAERGVRLRANVPETLAVSADRERLGQILRNLLSNAVTHTPEGGEVTVAAGASKGTIEVAVRDTGPGIAPEHLERVFDRFYRADPARARATGGSGLGLAIVKQLVEAHGGTARAESEVGRGAVFTFTLPAS
jgi:signal transduction histidine kinase